MTSYSTFRANDKKCATCSYWTGERQIVFSVKSPHSIKTQTGSASCVAYSSRINTANNACPRWKLWEKL